MSSHIVKAICSVEQLKQVPFLIRAVRFKNKETTAIIFHLNNDYYAYINHCMHMNRPLNIQEENIFDETGQYLRCSMHGFIFEPKTGECQSPVCLGQKLTPLRLKEENNLLYFTEKHLILCD